MCVITARTHGCVRNDSETHSTGVTGLHSRRFRAHTCVLAIMLHHCSFYWSSVKSFLANCFFNHWWPLSFALLQHSSMPADNQLGGHGDMWSHWFPEGIVNAASPNHLWFQCLGHDADLQINSNGSKFIQNWNCPIFLQWCFFYIYHQIENMNRKG